MGELIIKSIPDVASILSLMSPSSNIPPSHTFYLAKFDPFGSETIVSEKSPILGICADIYTNPSPKTPEAFLQKAFIKIFFGRLFPQMTDDEEFQIKLMCSWTEHLLKQDENNPVWPPIIITSNQHINFLKEQHQNLAGAFPSIGLSWSLIILIITIFSFNDIIIIIIITPLTIDTVAPKYLLWPKSHIVNAPNSVSASFPNFYCKWKRSSENWNTLKCLETSFKISLLLPQRQFQRCKYSHDRSPHNECLSFSDLLTAWNESFQTWLSQCWVESIQK